MRHSNSQQMVLSFIEQYQGDNQRPPTIREIQDHCGFKSPRAVSYILEKLEEARLIIRRAHSRGVQLTKPSLMSTGIQLPLFASIPAGLPDQFDGVFHYDETRAVEPLERTMEWTAGEIDETYPSGL